MLSRADPWRPPALEGVNEIEPGVFPSFEETAVQVKRHFQEGEFPSSHHREEGWPSNQENIAQHPLSLGRGGVPIAGTRNTSPAASIRRLRTIFLLTPPPLLAVMRGGEFAFSK
jgi:hypothetical protein